MSRVYRLGFRCRALAASVALLMLLSVACSRPMPWRTGGVSAAQGQAPFQAAANSGDSKAETPANSDQENDKSEAGLPFRERLDLPAGTLLTVHLNNAITAADARQGNSFHAIIDGLAQVRDATLMLRGASVVGRIEAAGNSKIERNRGYVRLILNSIHLDGRDIPVQTASLFVRGNSQNPASNSGSSLIGLQSGRQLTFRLTDSVVLSSASVH
jgi:hypothetical protein